MAGNVTDESMVEEVLAHFKEIEDGTVNIGIIGDSGKYQDTGMTVLDIANIHEFGSKYHPERSFIRATYDTNKNDIMNMATINISEVIKGNLTAQMYLNIMGQYGEDITRDYLRELDSPPLDPMTIKRKGSSSVLIDTGQLINSISYEVK